MKDQNENTNNTGETKRSMFPNLDLEKIEHEQLFVYFHQVRMDILMEGISFVGLWSDSTGQLLISVSDQMTRVEDGKIYLFSARSEETQNPESIADDFKDCVRQIMLGEADDFEAPHSKFPNY